MQDSGLSFWQGRPGAELRSPGLVAGALTPEASCLPTSPSVEGRVF